MKLAIGALLVALATSGASAPRAFVASSIAAGDYHTCALTSSGVKCWGDNTSGELGDGTTIRRSTPVAVTGLPDGIKAVSLGGVHTCALTGSAGVECWGWNAEGQVGSGPGTNQPRPVPARGLESGVAQIAGGGEHTCVLTTTGGVKCWGHNNFGGIGDGTRTPRPAPVDVVGLGSGVAAVAAGRHFTCAITVAGGVKCWGLNESGQVGDGTNENRWSPVDVVGLQHGITAIGAFGNHACAVLQSGGVKCWGANQSGELGDGTGADSSIPVDVKGLVGPVVAIAPGGRHAGGSHTCVVVEGGGVECWGGNTSGQLGDGTKTARPTPVRVTGLNSGAVAVAVGGYHSCALLATGGVRCWGWNGAGQLGDGTTRDRLTPVEVIEREVRDCVVPRVVGLRLARARAALARADCRAGRISRRYARKQRGRVIGQSPAAGERRAAGTAVALAVSRGRKPHR
jgi:alpha-tubulin suppressor-like RCC1 family protein